MGYAKDAFRDTHDMSDLRLRFGNRQLVHARCCVILVILATGILPTANFAAAPAAAPSAAVNPGYFGALRWRSIGPYRGGRALAVTGVPGSASTFYFGAVAGGVWQTTDGGGTWNPLTDDTPISSVGAIAVAPSNHDIIYVGTGEAAPRGDITYGDGVYKSTDGGKTWNHVGLEDTRQIGALIVDPDNPDIVLVAALGHAFGPNAERGLFRTADGANPGRRCSIVINKQEQSTSVSIRTIRKSSTRLCGRHAGSRGTFRAVVPVAGCTGPRMEA